MSIMQTNKCLYTRDCYLTLLLFIYFEHVKFIWIVCDGWQFYLYTLMFWKAQGPFGSSKWIPLHLGVDESTRRVVYSIQSTADFTLTIGTNNCKHPAIPWLYLHIYIYKIIKSRTFRGTKTSIALRDPSSVNSQGPRRQRICKCFTAPTAAACRWLVSNQSRIPLSPHCDAN